MRVKSKKRKKVFNPLFILTQSPGVNWYRAENYRKYMSDGMTWPEYGPDILPNWEQVVLAKKDVLFLLEKEWGKASMVISQRVSTRIGLATLMGMKSKHPRPVFCEIDDDVFAVESCSPGFGSVHPGSEAETMFKEQLEWSDGVIVSTEELKRIYSKYNKNIIVIPNGIDFKVWGIANKKKVKKNKKIKIVWQGSMNHFDDLKILSQVVPKILKEFKNVEFHFVGLLPDFIKQKGTFYHEPVITDKYPKYMVDINPDIILAPLKDHRFNRSKSNLRVLEAGAMKKAIVASSNPKLAYGQTIEHGHDGLLAKNTEDWIEYITYLIRCPEEREILGENLYEKVKEKYNVRKIAKEYEEILRRRK